MIILYRQKTKQYCLTARNLQLVGVVVLEGLLSFSLIPSSISLFTLLFASLNSRIPRPRPRMNSGILRPPKRTNTARMIKIHSVPPGIESNNIKALRENMIADLIER